MNTIKMDAIRKARDAHGLQRNKLSNQSPLETIRHLLANSLFTMTHGMSLQQWIGLLRQHRSEISVARLPRVAFITAMSALNTGIAKIEERRFGEQVAATTLEPPLFILGHWRSGTTLLHNLLACDPQFAAPTLLQTLYPQTFLLLERPMSLLASLVPRTRLIDNVKFSFDQPQEDEFALCNATLLSPYTGWMFPHSQPYYDRYLHMEEVSPHERSVWQHNFLKFLRKVSWRAGRRLVLKSPTHTSRIRLLLDLFPTASFVHINRDPYTVFQSTKHLHQVMFRATSLQSFGKINLDEFVLQRFELLYKNFQADKKLIPAGNYYELRFEELEREPLHAIEQLYAALGLKNFQRARPHLEYYAAANSGYRKNQFPPLTRELRRTIDKRWHVMLEQWGYGEATPQ